MQPAITDTISWHRIRWKLTQLNNSTNAFAEYLYTHKVYNYNDKHLSYIQLHGDLSYIFFDNDSRPWNNKENKVW